MARERKIRVRAVRRAEPDLRRLGRALIELAEAQAEADAQAAHEHAKTAADDKRQVKKARRAPGASS